jgi:hypothetical protein
MAGAGTGGGGVGGVTGGCGVTASRVRITEVDVGGAVVNNEDEAALMPLSISPIPSGGSRLAWMGNDARVHVTELDANDQVTGAAFSVPAKDFQDIYADNTGGVILLTRDAQGGGTLNCGAPTNLCGTPPNPPVPCYDMYLVRFNGTTEAWATKLTNSSAALPPYSTGPGGPTVYMIWWYAHHGRIVSDGTNYAAYFGAAISVSQNGCINIHQGDRAKIVNPSGTIVSGGFDWGCSHSGYERVVWDGAKYVYVCENDAPTAGKSGKIAFAPGANPLILPIDLWYTNMGDLVTGANGVWLTTSDIRAGQTAAANGLADVRLLHFTTGAPDQNLVLASDSGMNNRAPHLAAYGSSRMIAAWETATNTGNFARNSANRRLYVQTVSRATGAAEGAPLPVAVQGNRYHEFVGFPDGSVAFPAPGTTSTRVKILRILPCN